MTLEEAINTAIEYETRVRDVYAEARNRAASDVGKRVFGVLAEEEQGHLDFLQHQLAEWKKSGKLSPDHLETAIPPSEAITEAAAVLENRLAGDDRGTELKMLQKAYKVEVKTGDFYKKMVQELGPEGKALFARFVEIEEGHEMIVRAELDVLSNTGFWFDMPEFSLEAE